MRLRTNLSAVGWGGVWLLYGIVLFVPGIRVCGEPPEFPHPPGDVLEGTWHRGQIYTEAQIMQ